MLATGGIGRAFKITQNCWEYTGDGHALAYDAGAELIDMEFVQFHPTGMVWPPSVRGILVTEGVRGEGGMLRNNEGKRFMFDDIPDNYKTADRRQRGRGLALRAQGDKNARRPPELLTRDHVARCIDREVKAGRGSPHGGVFLDHSRGSRQKRVQRRRAHQEEAAEHVPPVQGAGGLDITKEPMEVGPTTHYMMGGIRRRRDTQMSRVPGLFAAGECAAGMHGANRLGGNSLSDLLVFGKRAGEYAAKYAKDNTAPAASPRSDARPRRSRRSSRSTASGGENPYQVQHDLQDMMQDLVGIVRKRRRDAAGARRAEELQRRAPRRCRSTATANTTPAGTPRIDLHNLLTVSEAMARAAHRAQGEPRRPFRDDYPEKDNAKFGKVNIVSARVGTARCRFASSRSRRCRRS